MMQTFIILHQSSEGGWHARLSEAICQHSFRLPQQFAGIHLYLTGVQMILK